MTLVLLCGFAFLAGLVDAVAGGGGLIQLPALFLFLPSGAASVPAFVFGTNKLSSICGTGVAVAQYSRRVALPWKILCPAAGVAFASSILGARLVSSLKPELLKPVVIALLIFVAIFTYLNNSRPRCISKITRKHELIYAIITGAWLGFYDGFFGPGTGTFLIFIFVGLFGFDFLLASASAKVVNFATNLAAVIYFASKGLIYYEYALPMGVCNVAGSLLGSRLAILKGSNFVRRIFLVVVAALILKLAWDVVRAYWQVRL